jgi:hypothetical protein
VKSSNSQREDFFQTMKTSAKALTTFMPRNIYAFCHNQCGQLQICIVLVAWGGGTLVSNSGFVGLKNSWDSNKPNQNGEDFFHFWNFHCILEVLVAN